MSDWSAPDSPPRRPSPPDVAPSHLVAAPLLAQEPVDRPAYPAPVSSGGPSTGTYVAMPRLMGAPAYARPPRPLVAATPRPFDPDDLPLEAWRSDDEWQVAEAALSAWQQRSGGADRGPIIQPSGGGLRGIATRLLRSGS